MLRILTRVAGALAALAGLALAVLGVWFAARLGGAGTAEFDAARPAGLPVVIPPGRAQPGRRRRRGHRHPGLGRHARGWPWPTPPTPTAVVGDARHVVVTGVVGARLGASRRRRGTGRGRRPSAPPTCGASRTTPRARSRVTVDQSDAPESVVVAATEGSRRSVTLRVVDKRWFVESVVGRARRALPRRRRGRGPLAAPPQAPRPAAVPGAGPHPTESASRARAAGHDPGPATSRSRPATPELDGGRPIDPAPPTDRGGRPMTRPTRRALLGGAAAGLALATAGCGITDALVGLHPAPTEQAARRPARRRGRAATSPPGCSRPRGRDRRRQGRLRPRGPARPSWPATPSPSPTSRRPAAPPATSRRRPRQGAEPTVLAQSRGRGWPRAILATTLDEATSTQYLHVMVSRSAAGRPSASRPSVPMLAGARLPSLGAGDAGAPARRGRRRRRDGHGAGPKAFAGYAAALARPAPKKPPAGVSVDDPFGKALARLGGGAGQGPRQAGHAHPEARAGHRARPVLPARRRRRRRVRRSCAAPTPSPCAPAPRSSSCPPGTPRSSARRR